MPGCLAAYEIEQIVGAEVTFLSQEDPENLVALGGALAAGGTQAGEVGKGSNHGDLAIW